MPAANLSPQERLELTNRALSGEDAKKLAEEYGVHISLVYYYQDKARKKVRDEKPILDEWAEIIHRVDG